MPGELVLDAHLIRRRPKWMMVELVMSPCCGGIPLVARYTKLSAMNTSLLNVYFVQILWSFLAFVFVFPFSILTPQYLIFFIFSIFCLQLCYYIGSWHEISQCGCSGINFSRLLFLIYRLHCCIFFVYFVPNVRKNFVSACTESLGFDVLCLEVAGLLLFLAWVTVFYLSYIIIVVYSIDLCLVIRNYALIMYSY